VATVQPSVGVSATSSIEQTIHHKQQSSGRPSSSWAALVTKSGTPETSTPSAPSTNKAANKSAKPAGKGASGPSKEAKAFNSNKDVVKATPHQQHKKNSQTDKSKKSKGENHVDKTTISPKEKEPSDTQVTSDNFMILCGLSCLLLCNDMKSE